jgi:hypothetical protein
MLGIVHKLFGVKKDLFVSGKNKVFAADDALQNPIYKLHLRLSETGLTGGARSFKQLVWPVARITYVNSRLGPEPHQISSGDSRACKKNWQAGTNHRAILGVARRVKRSVEFCLNPV